MNPFTPLFKPVTAWMPPLPLTLGWRPFLEPLPVDDLWMWLLIPLTIAIATVYKTLKLDDLNRLPWEIARLSTLIVLSMLAAAVVLGVLVTVVV